MSRANAVLLILATLGFIASSLGYALHMNAAATGIAPDDAARMLAAPGFFDDPPVRVDLSGLFLHPQDIALTTLLVMTWVALIYHALRCIRAPAPVRQAAQVPLIAALTLGAVWPWIALMHPLPGLLLATLMLAGLLNAAMQDQHRGRKPENSSALGFVAGWALLVWLAVLATLMQDRLGLLQAAAAVIAIMIGSVAAVSLQLRLGRRIGFSVALIWGLIGIAAGTVTTDATIATATVLAISIIAVALVRVTT